MNATAFGGEVEEMREAILDPGRGYHHLPRFFSRAEADRYREESAAFLESGPQLYGSINTDTMPDYVHPRSVDSVERTFRIYQFFHNRHSLETTALWRKALELRDEIESAWLDDPLYAAERSRLQNYVIVTKCLPDTGYLPKHRDYAGPIPLPLLQSWALLSEPGRDYTEGDFLLHTRSGRVVGFQKDLKVVKGDVVVFDKSLEHEVGLVKAAKEGGEGRWSVLIGVRAERHSWWQAWRRRVMYDARLQPLMHKRTRVRGQR